MSSAISATSGDSTAARAGLLRRITSLCYEALLLVALLFLCTLIFLLIAHDASSGWKRLAFQIYLVVMCGIYFVWCWTHGGQTLAMKTWRMRVITRGGAAVSWKRGFCRYFAAFAGLALAGVGFLWAFIDRDHQFLHDRLCGTQIVKL
ncbi:MAG TPA: RDD family protein [Burkholderiales bacterium]|nr:RDD family protein [Burkholderiales bacterium]